MNWDDVRHALAVTRTGSLLAAAKDLKVEHTTVGRRIEALEEVLGIRIFARSRSGYSLTQEGEALLPELRKIEEAALALERSAAAEGTRLEGYVCVTSPETFGACYLAPRLAAFARQHSGLEIELLTGGQILDLGRREADIAVRFFRSKDSSLTVRKVGVMRHGLYASQRYLETRPLRRGDLRGHAVLASKLEKGAVDAAWLAKRLAGTVPTLTSSMTFALLEAARADAGIAILPRYLGDHEPSLVYLPSADEPEESIWITVHKDVRSNRRVRAVLDFLATTLQNDAARLRGRN